MTRELHKTQIQSSTRKLVFQEFFESDSVLMGYCLPLKTLVITGQLDAVIKHCQFCNRNSKNITWIFKQNFYFSSSSSLLDIVMILEKGLLLQDKEDYSVRKERSFFLTKGRFNTKHPTEDERVFSYGRFTPHTLLEDLHLKPF